MKRTIFKTGHSLAITLPKNVLEELGWKEGDAVEVNCEEKKAWVQKSSKNTQLSMQLPVRHKLGEKINS